MAIDKEIKKKVIVDWLNAFPELSAFAQNKLYKILGCTIVGIELIKSPFSDNYSPYFVIYSLCENDIKKCLNGPILMVRLQNKKGLQFDIPYLKHSSLISEAVESFKKQITISLNGNVTLKSLFGFIDHQFSDILIKSNSAQQAKLFELEFYTALYVNDKNKMETVLNQIQQASKNWNMQMFEMWYGKFDEWLQSLQVTISRKDEFFKRIEINKQDKKIAKLQSSVLIMG